MLKFLSFCFLIIFLSACGVETSSSPIEGKNGSDYKTDNPDNGNGGSTDNNETDDPSTDNNETDVPSNDGGTAADSIFDTDGAVYDKNACDPSFYRIARDASYNGDSVGENGASVLSVAGQGLGIRSEYLDGDPQSADKTWVTLFYKDFPDTKHLNVQGYTSHIMDGVFLLSYDIAWSDESIIGIDNTMYVQSAKGTKPACYRLILNSVIGSQIGVQKVYR